MPKKSKTPEPGETPEEAFEQAPMGGVSRGERQPRVREYPKGKYEEEVRILKKRALQEAGLGARIYKGHLIDEDGSRIFINERHLIMVPGKMVSFTAIARDEHGAVVPARGFDDVEGYKFFFTELSHRIDPATGEYTPPVVLVLNSPHEKDALALRHAFAIEVKDGSESLAQLALYRLREFAGLEHAGRPYIEQIYEDETTS